MATQIFDSKHPILLDPQAHAESDAEPLARQYRGSAFRGFFYAMLFNVFLFLIGAGLWELWRVVRWP
ncbi:MAG TPA: hypothetical protein VMU92_05285 [Acidobacteriaceae bacterium]|nr:hypothetical protein [Acidobacteriaceae bacterium]